MNKLPVPLLATVAGAFLISYYSLTIDRATARIDAVVNSSDHNNLKYVIQEIQKNFPDNLNNSVLMERLSVLKETIWEYEDIIQGQLDDPARSEGMRIIEEQNRKIEELKSEQTPDELNEMIYKEYKNQLITLVIFVEKNFPKETNQCKKSNTSI